ncbi:MAG: flagellar basal body rod protein FlgB [bacterium]|jgi:flagellar basal-body rod protein FlgB
MDIAGKDLTLAVIRKSLDLLNARQEAIAGNLANVNTPGYVRRDVDFAGEIARALGDSSVTSKDQLLGSIKAIEPEIIEQRGIAFRYDGGGVDVDREMAEEARTHLLYNAFIGLAEKRGRMYRAVIMDGRV